MPYYIDGEVEEADKITPRDSAFFKNKYNVDVRTSTGIFQIFGMTVALTGLSEKEAIKEGFDVEVCHNIKPNKPEYMGG